MYSFPALGNPVAGQRQKTLRPIAFHDFVNLSPPPTTVLSPGPTGLGSTCLLPREASANVLLNSEFPRIKLDQRSDMIAWQRLQEWVAMGH